MNTEEINILENVIDKEEEKIIFIELSKIEGIQDYLKAVMAADIKKYFVAQPGQHDYIKGGYDRLMQFLMKIQKSSSIDKVE